MQGAAGPAERLKRKGAIFDADGTLLDSMSVWDTLGEKYLRKKGIVPEKDIRETIKNMSLPQAAVYFQTAYGIADTEDKIIEDINEIAASFYINEVKLKEGVKTVLDKLKQKT
ncbi:MAG: HAD hydrolase-like protein [Eisenbergiella sp.]